MRLGLGLGYAGARVHVDVQAVQEADRLGFHSVWSAEAYGSDAVTTTRVGRRRRPSASSSAPRSCRCPRARRR